MFFLRRPSPQILERFRQVAEQDSFSYSELCGTLKEPLPSGYNVDHNRVCLGRGEDTFERVCSALADWKMFDLGWVELMHPHGPVAPDQTVLILARAWGFYSLSASRVVAMIG